MTSPVPLARRVMKARKGGTCALCPGPITVGQQIALIPGWGWCHTRCAIEARQAAVSKVCTPSGPTPGNVHST